jgi:hypothetical protein
VSDQQTPEPMPEPTPEQVSAAPAPEPTAAYAAPYAPAPKPDRRPLWIGIGAGAAVVAVGLGGFAVAAAVTNGNDHPMGFERIGMMGNGSADGDRDGGGMMGPNDGDNDAGPGSMMGGLGGLVGPMMGGLGGLGGGAPLHGELVIEDASGDAVTVLMQRGDVTAVNATSISLKSSDGFTQTFTLDDQTKVASPDAGNGIDGIAVGDTVQVVGQDTGGGEPTAQLVLEGLGGFGPMMGRESA